ncbi:MAG: helix-turn-helix transcriptional regulator [Symbiobacteriaceae bacterium]|nr:helix-turn-helix transcriptional regulator [Symbiobacteriaceae bacterium]
MSLGGNLRRLREKSSLTQKEVAQAIGVSERVYGFYESGRFPKDEIILSKLAWLFGITISELFDLDKESGVPPEFVILARKTDDLPKETREAIYHMIDQTIDSVLLLLDEEAKTRGKKP